MPASLNAILSQFDSVGLKQIENYPSMKRTDTKFLFHQNMLSEVLQKASAYFSILEIDGIRIAQYQNYYFDTQALKFYFDHHKNKRNRFKIRLREYANSNLQFLEIKEKNNKGLTKKVRTPVSFNQPELTDVHYDFINKHTNQSLDLELSIENKFNRVTLVHLENHERITFDFSLTCTNLTNEGKFDNLVIAEVKQYQKDFSSPIIKIFKTLGVRPEGFSKYCISKAYLNKDLKQNRFKRKFRKINKLTA